MKAIVIPAKISKITRQQKNSEAKMFVEISAENSVKIPLGDVSLTIEKSQKELFDGEEA